MTIETSREAFQVLLEKSSKSCTTFTQAKQACAEFGARLLLLPDIDPSHGLWMVRLPVGMAKRLQRRGFLEVIKGEYRLSAEMP